MKKYDLIVIGGGPAGYTAALEAARLGKSVALFEKEVVGGTCLNVGCIPTKVLVDKANLLHKIRSNIANDILKDSGQFSFKAIQREKSKVVKKLTEGVEALLNFSGIDIYHCDAIIQNDGTIIGSGQQYSSEHIILATGTRPAVNHKIDPNGVAINSTELLALNHLPKKLFVIGAGVIGLEMASIFNQFGSDVTILDIKPNLLGGVASEIEEYYLSEIENSGIAVKLSASIKKLEKAEGTNQITYSWNNSQITETADVVLLAIGRTPDLSVFEDPTIIKHTDNGYIQVDNRYQTSIKNVFAIGDIIGELQLAHNAYHHARMVIKAIYTEDLLVKQVIPQCIYTIPQVAIISDEQIIDNRDKTGTFLYQDNGMALAEGLKSGKIWVKTVEDRIKEVIIVGEQAAELINTAGIAIANQMTVSDWEEKVMIAHPTLSEALHEAILDSIGHSLHKPLKQ